ncbi:MAG: tRNA (adenosine(37)-N6)-threonylcarbamoyltransferase complex ATPase subunit type 1 TsaE, partial [Bacteroidia bacterium]
MKELLNRKFGEFEINKLANELKQLFTAHKKVMFKGEVGAGKTTLIKALAQAFLVFDHVDSPTFSLVNEYVGEISIYHFDLYRLKGYEELIDIG